MPAKAATASRMTGKRGSCGSVAMADIPFSRVSPARGSMLACTSAVHVPPQTMNDPVPRVAPDSGSDAAAPPLAEAARAAAALDIQLTKRGRHEGEDIPMCGVPVHAAEAYLARLIRQGFRVAVCEQMEEPAEAKKRGSKAAIRRAVVRIVTPGTITEEGLLDARRNNYLAALAEAGGELALAWLELSTGAFRLQPVAASALAAALARIEPGELLVPERLIQRPEFFELLAERKSALTPLPNARFDSENGRKRLEALFAVRALDAFGSFARAELAAGGALVDYVALTQRRSEE